MEICEDIGTKTMVQSFKEQENENSDVCTVILKVDNPKLGIDKKVFELELCGKTFLEWIENSVFDTTIRYADYVFGEDFLPAVKRVVDTNSKYTLVLFADTPLFEHKTMLQIMEYFKSKGLSVLKLTRGFVFETKYLLQIDNLLNPQMQYFDEDDFITCHSLKQYSMICEIMKNRILNYFMKNGVVFEDVGTTFVDADVQIGQNTIVKPFNQIKGKTIIEKGVVLGSNNILTNCVICENANISGSVIKNSLIEKDCKVCEFSTIENSKIKEGAIVPAHCNVKNAVVTKDDELKSFFSYVGE